MRQFMLFPMGIIFLFFVTVMHSANGQVNGIPANVTASGESGRAIVSWDSVANATSYNLYLSRHSGINNSNYQSLAGMQIAGVESPYQLTGLNNETTYYLVVTSVNSSGESLPSDEVNVTPQSSLNSPVLFEDISLTSGLTRKILPAYGNPLWGDINNDGNLDIVDPHHKPSISVYLNNGNETFADITDNSGIALGNAFDRHGMGLGDYDNDGNLDLFVSLGGASGSSLLNSQLWKGDGTGSFINAINGSGIQLLEARTANWIDYDNDGHLDLFVARGGRSGKVYKNNKNGTFDDVTNSVGLVELFDRVVSFIDYDNDGFMDLFTGGTEDRLYRNNGNGTFSLNGSFIGKSEICRGAAWGDYNNDGLMDLYVARGQNDYYKTLFWDESRIDFAFSEFPDPGELTFKCDSSQNIVFDLQMDGKFPRTSFIFLGNQKNNPPSNPFTLNSTEVLEKPTIIAGGEDGFFIWKDTDNTWHIQWTESGGNHNFSGKITSDGDFSDVTINSANLSLTNYKSNLYRNNGNGTFTDVTEESGTGHIGNNSGVLWGDFDNDGLLDLYVVDAGDIVGNRSNTLYRNLGNGTFEDITTTAQVGAINARGRHYGAAWGDLNNDGLLDLLLANGYGWGYSLSRGRSMLYKNIGNNNNWIKIKPIGTLSNRSGIGARVILTTSSGIQTRQLNGNGGDAYSQGLSPFHFGLGNESTVEDVTIFWPSGVVQALGQTLANQELIVIEPEQDEWAEEAYLSLWSVGGNAANPIADFSNRVSGASSISATRIATGWIALKLGFPQNLVLNPSNTSMRFQVYPEDAGERILSIRFLAPNWANRFIYRVSSPLSAGVWNQFDVELSNFSIEAGNPDWNTISNARIIFAGGNSGNSINIDQLYFDNR
ncbi:MAG: FG-GAP-like repeat-containing protein [Candidatus Brocadiaceae bacterium]|nr:FG-GAP-like repeat-containing protein [Candidatus Brocadiaceae bacterium]